jgi:hypothetical protein
MRLGLRLPLDRSRSDPRRLRIVKTSTSLLELVDERSVLRSQAFLQMYQLLMRSPSGLLMAIS